MPHTAHKDASKRATDLPHEQAVVRVGLELVSIEDVLVRHHVLNAIGKCGQYVVQPIHVVLHLRQF